MGRYDHFLSVGGTGMLAQATVAFAAKSERQTIVSRRADDFVQLHGLSQADAVAADWRDAAALVTTLAARLSRKDPVDLCVFWLHDTPLSGLIKLLVGPCLILHVLGTGAGDLASRATAARRLVAPHAHLKYVYVALGSKAGRWLTHDEISGGLIEAERTRRDTVVGEL